MYFQDVKGVILEEVLDLSKPVYAHTPEGEGEKELLTQHVDRCEKYFRKLTGKRQMSQALESMEDILFQDINPVYRNWFRRMILGIIFWHDSGKRGHLFQRVKMENLCIPENEVSAISDSNHSLLSAAFFLNFYLREMEGLEEEAKLNGKEKVFLYKLLVQCTWVIARHHSTLSDFSSFLNEFYEGGKLCCIEKAMKETEKREFSSIYLVSACKTDWVELCAAEHWKSEDEAQQFACFFHTKLLFSLLVACDYYATSEYHSGKEVSYFGSADVIQGIRQAYEGTPLVQSIRKYKEDRNKSTMSEINVLRNELFFEAEENMQKHRQENVFFLEAPTGAGKSNMAFNCSFQLLQEGCEKLIYIYPFNNLVEQNKATLEKLFEGTDVKYQITVLNSVTSVKKEDQKEALSVDYQKTLLDRQFWNYPLVLTTHVSFFQLLYGTRREDLFALHQLVGGVLVLDEIQSYKNTLWAEIMKTLQYLGRFFHCKILIMSATLPDLTYLTGEKTGTVKLITNREKYFLAEPFKNRVHFHYDLLSGTKESEDDKMTALMEHVKRNAQPGKKILMEFITKKEAYKFFEMLLEEEEVTSHIDLLTGDDNVVDRKRVIEKISSPVYVQQGCILVSTQIVEAGIDIDMDIGYKNISLWDSEEQFAGRINRNAKREGDVFFFNTSDPRKIYSQDCRSDAHFTLENEEMRPLLEEKDTPAYYEKIMQVVKKNRNDSSTDKGIHSFVFEMVGKLACEKVEKKMRLLEEDNWNMQVFLARKIMVEGKEVDGNRVWQQYKELLSDTALEYAEFRVKLYDTMALLSMFLYKIKKSSHISYHDKIGEIYCIEDGEQYFEDGRLNKTKLEKTGALFFGA